MTKNDDVKGTGASTGGAGSGSELEIAATLLDWAGESVADGSAISDDRRAEIYRDAQEIVAQGITATTLSMVAGGYLSEERLLLISLVAQQHLSRAVGGAASLGIGSVARAAARMTAATLADRTETESEQK